MFLKQSILCKFISVFIIISISLINIQTCYAQSKNCSSLKLTCLAPKTVNTDEEEVLIEFPNLESFLQSKRISINPNFLPKRDQRLFLEISETNKIFIVKKNKNYFLIKPVEGRTGKYVMVPLNNERVDIAIKNRGWNSTIYTVYRIIKVVLLFVGILLLVAGILTMIIPNLIIVAASVFVAVISIIVAFWFVWIIPVIALWLLDDYSEDYRKFKKKVSTFFKSIIPSIKYKLHKNQINRIYKKIILLGNASNQQNLTYFRIAA